MPLWPLRLRNPPAPAAGVPLRRTRARCAPPRADPGAFPNGARNPIWHGPKTVQMGLSAPFGIRTFAEGGLSHLISTIFEKLLAPARGIAYINNPQADMAQLVEHNLAKVGVAGSSPVVRSIAFPDRLGGPFSAKWPSGKAEACKAFTPGSNPGFASRPPKGPSERRAPFRSRAPDTNRAAGAAAHGTRGDTGSRRPGEGHPVRTRVLFQMEQKVPSGTGPRRSKWDFLLHLGFEPLLRMGMFLEDSSTLCFR